MSLIDTYQLATGGQNFISTSTLASNGILLQIIIEPLPDIIRPLGGSVTSNIPKVDKKKKDKKKVTVIATIKGIEYKKSVIVKDRPNLSVEDVRVEINESGKKPMINISIIKEG